MKYISSVLFLTISFRVKFSSSTSNVVQLAEGENDCASQGFADVTIEEGYEISQADTTPIAEHEFDNYPFAPKGCVYHTNHDWHYFNHDASGSASSYYNKLCLDGEFIMSNDKSYS